MIRAERPCAIILELQGCCCCLWFFGNLLDGQQPLVFDFAHLHQSFFLIMYRKRKLCLVLDLDHTLVNSSKYNEVEPELAARLQEQLSAEAMAGLDASQKGLHAMGHIGMWTKLRPGIREFLAAAAQSFELWIHTNGNRSGLAPL